MYRCRFSTDDYEDNEEDSDSPEYEEWYALDFKIVEIVKDGPNRDPRFEYTCCLASICPLLSRATARLSAKRRALLPAALRFAWTYGPLIGTYCPRCVRINYYAGVAKW